MMNRFYLVIAYLFFLNTSFSQNFDFYAPAKEFEYYGYYLDLNKTFKVYIDSDSTILNEDNSVKAKVKSKELKIKREDYAFSITPLKTGKAKLTAKVKLNNGQTIIIEKVYEVVDLPELELAIDVTSPDSKFSWLKITNKTTGEPFDALPYDFHWFDFELKDSLGEVKENAVYVKEGDFFPSVTLTNLHTLFEIGDELDVCISLIHKKYGLYLNCCQTILIKKLWK